jgi:LysR family transcriptional regulator, nitrogen assimilation regulatory protein
VDIRQIRYFVAIVDYGSLTRAATQLRIAQPALSQQLSHLESEFKAQLLLRSSHGVKPTEAGKVLYRHARLVLRQLEQAHEEIQHGALGESGPVALGLPTTVTLALAVPLLKAVRKRYPGIRLQMFESLSGYLSELLANSRLDLAVLFRDMETRGVSFQTLAYEQLFLIGECGLSEAVKAREVCSLTDLHEVPLVLPGVAHDLRLMLERAFAQQRVEPNIIADLDSLPTMVSAALDGLACTILPASAVLSFSNRDREPPMRRIASPEIGRPISLCWLESAPRSPAAIAVQKLIVSLMPELIADGRWPGILLKQDEGQEVKT